MKSVSRARDIHDLSERRGHDGALASNFVAPERDQSDMLPPALTDQLAEPFVHVLPSGSPSMPTSAIPTRHWWPRGAGPTTRTWWLPKLSCGPQDVERSRSGMPADCPSEPAFWASATW
jgi:hypothetical protein